VGGSICPAVLKAAAVPRMPDVLSGAGIVPRKRKIERLMDLHHPLLADFPEYREVILKLNVESRYFHNLFDEYHQIDDEICRLEEGQERSTDQELETLKIRRVVLKDMLYHELRVAAIGTPVHAVA
jgi:hypothetical protein